MTKRLPRGVLVAFEGIDGSGKTTQANLLAELLRSRGVEVVKTKEPTAGPWGQALRDSKLKGRMSPEDELHYFLEDRRQHVAEEIDPALRAGRVVIVDRYYYSTVAYQGARGLDPAELLRTNRAFAPVPDLLVLLDVDPKIGIARIHERGSRQDHFEGLDNLIKVRAVFASLHEPHVLRIDGTLSIPEIHATVVHRLSQGPLGAFL